MAFSLVAVIGGAQVIFYVNDPSPNEGNYDFSYAEAGSGWGVADLTDPANSIESNLVMVDDGTGDSPIACDPILNAAELAGNIAVLYRGDCEFGAKALACETAGAIGVVIVNNVPGAPISMGGGADGGSVTIPVAMITDTDGALLQTEILAGTSTAFIGSKSGFYENDLGFYPQHILMPEQFSNLQLLSQDDTEFSVELGAWVHNYGSETQTNVTLSATIDVGASNVYNETSTPVASILSGDSVFIALPTYSEASYANGYYHVDYIIASDAADEFLADNELPADFTMSDSIFGYSRVNESLQPNGVAYFRGASSTASNSACLAFSDPNASRMGIAGMTFSASSSQNPDPTSLDGEFVQVFAYQWNDVFTDINDAGFAISLLDEITSGEYIYLSDLQQENVYLPFEDPFVMEDGQRYLFCVTHYGENIFLGYDTEIDYRENQNTYAQPVFPGESDGSFFTNGFGTDIVPASTVHMFDADELSVVELPLVDLDAYPNPATTVINIPLTEDKGDAQLMVFDLSGKLISTQNASMNGNMLQFDVTSIAAGTYVVDLEFENGEKGTINIVVAH